MSGRDEHARQAREDAEWRSIVENFGDRAEIGEPEVIVPAAPEPVQDEPAELASSPWDDEEHFVPPEPPPLPRPQGARLAAWFGVFGIPTLALLATVVGLSLPSYLALVMIAWFVGGFGYLVATMSNRDADSGWDDGAVL